MEVRYEAHIQKKKIIKKIFPLKLNSFFKEKNFQNIQEEKRKQSI